ncbi:MAG: hypothetical protein ABI758_06420 [Candidatus Woesebacteria bacterium]
MIESHLPPQLEDEILFFETSGLTLETLATFLKAIERFQADVPKLQGYPIRPLLDELSQIDDSEAVIEKTTAYEKAIEIAKMLKKVDPQLAERIVLLAQVSAV